MTHTSAKKNRARSKARRKLERLGLIVDCNICRSNEYLEVHHIDNNVFNDDLSNLQVRCYKCHNEAHGKHYNGDTGKPFSRKAKKEAKALRLAAVPKVDFYAVVSEMEKYGYKFCKLSPKLNFFYKNDNKNLIIDVKYVMMYVRERGNMNGLEEFCEGKAEIWGFVNTYYIDED